MRSDFAAYFRKASPEKKSSKNLKTNPNSLKNNLGIKGIVFNKKTSIFSRQPGGGVFIMSHPLERVLLLKAAINPKNTHIP